MVSHEAELNGEPQPAAPALSRCRKCQEEKNLEDFGTDRARADGRNIYCRPCIRIKVNRQRAERIAKENAHRAALYRRKPNVMAPRPNPNRDWIIAATSDAEIILRAIEAGANTQSAMHKILKTWTPDRLTDALADLMFPLDGPPRIAAQKIVGATTNWNADQRIYKIAA